MSSKPVVIRERAEQDIDGAVEHYLTEAGQAIALDLIDAFQDTCCRIGERPASGSPRYAHELDISGPRVLPVEKFPYLVSYVDGEMNIDVWRVLHGARGIPAWTGEPT